MQVLVLGKLGDACKKLIELELLQEKEPRNALLAADIQAHKNMIADWPKPNEKDGDFDLRLSQLRIDLNNLSALEKEIREYCKRSDDDLYLWRSHMAVRQYFEKIDWIRASIAKLNTIGSAGVVNQDNKSVGA